MILGRSTQPTVTNKYDAIDFNIAVESCEYVDIFTEATEELAALESAMYVADIMLEEQVLEGATNVDILLEGVVSSMYGRLKDIVQKFWAKIKQWFANVKKYFQMLLSHGKDFVKKYKTDIIKAEARCKGFKYEAYVSAKNLVEPYRGKIKNPKGLADELLSKNEGKSNNEIVKSFMKSMYWGKAESQSEVTKEYMDQYIGEKEEFEDFNGGPTVQTLIARLENADKFVKGFNDSEKEISRACAQVIKELEAEDRQSAKDAADDETGNTKYDRAYPLAVDLLKASCNHIVSMLNCDKTLTKIKAKEAESILKRLVTHRPKKESFETVDFDGQDSLLESALKLI